MYYYLLKLHNRLRSSGSIQRKNVVRSVDFLLFLDIFGRCHNLPKEVHWKCICMLSDWQYYNRKKLEGITARRTNLGSNFFNFLSLINGTEHFKKHTGCLVSFPKLSSAKKSEKEICWHSRPSLVHTFKTTIALLITCLPGLLGPML